MFSFLLEIQEKVQAQNINLRSISVQVIVEEMGANDHQWRKHVKCEKKRVPSTEIISCRCEEKMDLKWEGMM